MPFTTDDRRSDVAALTRAVEFIEAFMAWVVNPDTRLVDESIRKQASAVWPEISGAIGTAKGVLSQLNERDTETWLSLESAGLTGQQLTLKMRIGKHVASPPREHVDPVSPDNPESSAGLGQGVWLDKFDAGKLIPAF